VGNAGRDQWGLRIPLGRNRNVAPHGGLYKL